MTDELMHYGVKGMRWGHRKASSESSGTSSSGSKGLTDGQKKALKYAVGGALAAGAVIGVAILAKNGNIPAHSISLPRANVNRPTMSTSRPTASTSRPTVSKPTANPQTSSSSKTRTTSRGKQAAEALQASRKLDQMIRDFREQMAEDQRRDTQYMIRDSASAGVGYNPARDNEFSPEAKRA